MLKKTENAPLKTFFRKEKKRMMKKN